MNASIKSCFILSLFLLLSLCAGLHADVVSLKNGEKISGKIIGRGADGVALRTLEGRITYFNADEVRRVYLNVDTLDASPSAGAPIPADTNSLETQFYEPDIQSAPPELPSAPVPPALFSPATPPFDPHQMFQMEELSAGRQAQMAAGSVLYTIGSVGQLIAAFIVIVAAFRDQGFFKGILTICCWPYWLYFAISYYESPHRKRVLWLYFISFIINIAGAVLQQSVMFEQFAPVLRNIFKTIQQ